MIEISNVSKYYDNLQVLKNINLKIENNEVFGLVGTSGVGKSTLLNCLIGLEKYQEGSICIDGIKIETLSDEKMRMFRKNMGMIFQNFSLVNRKNVFQNIALPMECWHMPKKYIQKKVHELAELVGIQDKLNARPFELSGGQKQRVAIARALTMDPKYILCDECTSALDPKTTTSILKLLEDIRRNMEITIIVVTHEMPVVQQICHRMAILENGEVSLTGNVQEMFLEQPYELQNLLGDIEKELPSSGVNIMFSLASEGGEKKILWELAKNTKEPFVLQGMKSYDFPNGRYWEIIINIQKDDITWCKACFNSYKIKYKVLGDL